MTRRQKDQRHDGLLLAVLVHSADIQNRMGAGALLVRLGRLARLWLCCARTGCNSVSRQASSGRMRVCRIRNRSKFRGYENGFPAHSTRTYCY